MGSSKLVQFDLSSIPTNATIIDAELKLNCTQDYITDIRIYELDTAWSETTVTYNNMPYGTTQCIPASTISDVSMGWNSGDVTAIVQSWYDGSCENNGFHLFVWESDTTNWGQFYYRETLTGLGPKLTITYSVINNLVAGFTWNQNYIQVGESVSFIDTSTGSPNSWQWYFEDGTPYDTNIQNPTINYSTSGVFGVTLIISNGDLSDTLTIDSCITVGEEPIKRIPIGDLYVYFDECDTIDLNNGIYDVYGNISIDNVLIMTGTLRVNQNESFLMGDSLIYIQNIPFMGDTNTIQLYNGNYWFYVERSQLFAYELLVTNNIFELAELPVSIYNLSVLTNGICINGNIEFPEIIDSSSSEINGIYITYNGIYLSTALHIDKIGIYKKTFSIENLNLSFDSYENKFSGNCMLNTSIINFEISAEFIHSKLDSLKAGFNGSSIPIGTTGLSITGGGASVKGLQNPPLSLKAGVDIKCDPLPFIVFKDVHLQYTFTGGPLEGGGNLEVFNSQIASASIEATPNYCEINGEVSLTPSLEFLKGELSTGIYNKGDSTNPNVVLEGSLCGSLLIPELDWPYGPIFNSILKLPHRIAYSENYLKNKIIKGNMNLFNNKFHYTINWDGWAFNYHLGNGFQNLNEKLFNIQKSQFNLGNNYSNDLEGYSQILTSKILEFDLYIPTNTIIISLQNDYEIPLCSIITPDSSYITPSNIDNEGINYLENEESHNAFYLFNNPLLGHYKIIVENELDSVKINILGVLISPIIEVMPLIKFYYSPFFRPRFCFS
ncbi:MAG: DNRLRE domain-containing protein [Thermodesulfovibrionales bacterium]